MINADRICWDLAPVDTRDAESPAYLADLPPHDLLHWAFGAQDDIEALRLTLRRSITVLADVLQERDILRQRNRELREQIQGLITT